MIDQEAPEARAEGEGRSGATIGPEAPDLDRFLAWYEEAREFWDPEFEKMREDFGFHTGDGQWDPQVLAQLEQEGRPALTINLIFRQNNLVFGEEESNRTEPVVVPKGEVVEEALDAERMTKLLHHVYRDENDGDYLGSEVFQNGVIGGQSWLAVPISYEEDPVDGEVKLFEPHWSTVLPDPRARSYELKDARYLFVEYELDLDEALETYPDKTDEIKNALTRLQVEPDASSGRYAVVHDVHLGDLYLDAKHRDLGLVSGRGQVKILECWHRTYDAVDLLVDQQSGDFRRVDEAPGALQMAQSLAATQPDRFSLLRHRLQMMRVAVLLPLTKTVLDEGPTPYRLVNGMPDPDYPYARFCAYLIDGKPSGVTRQLKDPQREKNKRRSQMLHMLNTSAKPGIDYEEGALADGRDEKWLEEEYARTGSVIKWARNALSGAKVQHREGTGGIPPALFKMDLEAEQELKAISGINADALGERGGDAGTSGRAVLLRQQQAQKVSTPIFSNWSRTKRHVARLLVRRIQQVYTVPRVLRITDRDMQEETLDLNQPVFDPQAGAERVIHQVGLMEYNVAISESPSNPTLRITNFLQLRELQAIYREAGVPFPIGVIVDQTDLPLKVKQTLKSSLPQQLGGSAPPVSPPGPPGPLGVAPPPAGGILGLLRARRAAGPA